MWHIASRWKSCPNELTKLCTVLLNLGTFCFLCKSNTAGTETFLDVFNCPIFLAWNVVSLTTWYCGNLQFQKNCPHTEFKGQNTVFYCYIIFVLAERKQWKKPQRVTKSFSTRRLAIPKPFLADDCLMLVYKISSGRESRKSSDSLFQSSLCSLTWFRHLGMSYSAYNLSLLKTQQFVLFITFYIFKECYHPLQPPPL